MDLPGLNGLDIARARQRERLSFDIIFLTMHREEDMFHEAMALRAKGYMLKESAAALGLSPRTVENHRSNMSAKLGLQGNHSLLTFAFENRSRLTD